MNWKNWALVKPFADLYHMFFNNDKGFSWRKVVGTVSVFFAKAMFDKLKDEKLILEAGNIWLVFAGVCIGLIAVAEVIKFVTTVLGKSDNTPPAPTP